MRSIALPGTAAIALLAAVPASALTISGTYYEDQANRTCVTTNYCEAQFTLPSVAGFVNLEQVSCSGLVGAQVVSGQIFISDAGSNKRRYQFLSMTGVQGAGQFSSAEPVKMKVAAGPPRVVHLGIYVSSTLTWTFSCSVVGTLSTQ